MPSEVHMKQVNDTHFKCDLCGQNFKTEFILRRHVIGHSENSHKCFFGEFCNNSGLLAKFGVSCNNFGVTCICFEALGFSFSVFWWQLCSILRYFAAETPK